MAVPQENIGVDPTAIPPTMTREQCMCPECAFGPPLKPKATGGQWVKKDGSKVAIADMTDGHIQNSINMLKRLIVRTEAKIATFETEQKRRKDERERQAAEANKRRVVQSNTRMFRDDE